MEISSSEREMVLQARAGDAGAYAALVQHHQEAAFRAAYLILRDAQAAEDVAQEAFIRAYKALHQFHDQSAFRPWVLRIVTNLALNQVRARGRRLSLLEHLGRRVVETQPPTDEAILATEQARAVWYAINRLPIDDRVVLYLRYFLDQSEEDMARVIGKAPGTVKSRLHRAGQRAPGHRTRLPTTEDGLMNQQMLDDLLTSTASSLTYPATPDLSSHVAARLASLAPRRTMRSQRTWAYVVAALLLGLIVALGFSPSRDAIARLFGVEGSQIEVVPDLGLTEQPSALSFANRPAQVVELKDLPNLMGFEAALPAISEERFDSLAILYGTQWIVIHHYGSFHLWQTKLPQDANFGKFITEDSILQEPSVNGVDAIWLSGGTHLVHYLDEQGEVISASVRTVQASTLIWRTDAFFYRIETDLTLQETLRIAETLP